EGLWQEVGWRTIQAYGLSECSPALTQQHLGDFWNGRGTVGTLLHGIEMRLTKLGGNEEMIGNGEEVEDGEAGELMVRGANIFHGYLNREEETTVCLRRDGW